MPPLSHAVAGLESTARRNLRRPEASAEHVNTVVKLLDHGADPTIKVSGKHTEKRPLISYIFHLVSCQQLTISHPIRLVNRLLRSGADPNAIDKCGMAPIHHTIQLNNHAWLQALRVLLDYGAHPNLEDTDGCTPLGWALRMKDPDNITRRGLPHHQHVIRMLIDYGADPARLVQGRHGLLSLAIHSTQSFPDSTAIMETLLRHGADPNVGEYAVDSPAGRGNKSVLCQALVVTYWGMGFVSAKADLDTLAPIFRQRQATLIQRGDVDAAEPVTLRLLPDRVWNNPMIPKLLKARARVSRADMQCVRNVLISIVS